jgi:hypothetical protein
MMKVSPRSDSTVSLFLGRGTQIPFERYLRHYSRPFREATQVIIEDDIVDLQIEGRVRFIIIFDGISAAIYQGKRTARQSLY